MGWTERNHTVKNFTFAEISSYLNTFAKINSANKTFFKLCADILRYNNKSLNTSEISDKNSRCVTNNRVQ